MTQTIPSNLGKTPVSTSSAILEVPTERRPRHIAVIMDGNGRWALQRNLSRIDGHRAGAKTVRRIVTECSKLGLEALTLYSFSIENWKRPALEVSALMMLYLEYLALERQELIDNNIRFTQIGRRDGLPQQVLKATEDAIAATENCTGLNLVLALNYGGRTEITDAVRNIAGKVQRGELDVDHITEETISDHLYTKGISDPDLLIRTAGECRISNYLLWQISYAEIHVSPVYWPDFHEEHLHEAIRDYARRNRRYGALDESNT